MDSTDLYNGAFYVLVICLIFYVALEACISGPFPPPERPPHNPNPNVVVFVRDHRPAPLPRQPIIPARDIPLNVNTFPEGSARKEERANECSICFTEFKKGEISTVLKGCGHKFHADCISAWFTRKLNCPICRTVPL